MFQKRYNLRRRNCVQAKRPSRAKRLVKTKLPELLLYTSYLHVNINVVTDETGGIGDSNVGGICGGGGGAGDNGVIPSTPTSLSSELSMDSAQFPHRPASVSSNGDARTGVADLGDTSTIAITNHHHQLQNQSSLVSQNDTTINTSVSSSAPSTPTAGTKRFSLSWLIHTARERDQDRMGPRAIGSYYTCIVLKCTGLRHGKEPESIVAYCAGPFCPCPGPGPIPMQCE